MKNILKVVVLLACNIAFPVVVWQVCFQNSKAGQTATDGQAEMPEMLRQINRGSPIRLNSPLGVIEASSFGIDGVMLSIRQKTLGKAAMTCQRSELFYIDYRGLVHTQERFAVEEGLGCPTGFPLTQEDSEEYGSYIQTRAIMLIREIYRVHFGRN